jgi:hypothetical protein
MSKKPAKVRTHKRKKAPPVVTRGPKRDTRFKMGNSAGVDTHFKPGQSGNPAGRPLGARSKLSEALLKSFLAAWERYGERALTWMIKNDPVGFVHVAASLVPRHMKAEIEETRAVYHIADRPLTDDEWAKEFCDPPFAVDSGKPN